jgi:hypothetical protein
MRELVRHNKSGEYIIIEIKGDRVIGESDTLNQSYLISISHNLIQLDDFDLNVIDEPLSAYNDWD